MHSIQNIMISITFSRSNLLLSLTDGKMNEFKQNYFLVPFTRKVAITNAEGFSSWKRQSPVNKKSVNHSSYKHFFGVKHFRHFLLLGFPGSGLYPHSH